MFRVHLRWAFADTSPVITHPPKFPTYSSDLLCLDYLRFVEMMSLEWAPQTDYADYLYPGRGGTRQRLRNCISE